jgi:hypothetical protein
MRLRINRRFQMVDVIVVVAATGCGLAGCRFWMWSSKIDLDNSWPAENEPLLETIWSMALELVPIESIMLLCWTMAILLLRLRPARPRRRHLWCQPGFLACVTAIFVFAWKGLGVSLYIAGQVLTANPAKFSQITFGHIAYDLAFMLISFPLDTQADAGAAILLIWLVTWAGGRCRPEPSWVDRAGRVLGAIWVCTALFAVPAMYLS